MDSGGDRLYTRYRRPLKPQDYVVARSSPLPAWVERANRAHLNAVENIASFAAVALIAKAVGISTHVTEISAMVHFYARAAHAVVHITGFSLFMARTILFTVGWLAFMTFAVELLRKTM